MKKHFKVFLAFAIAFFIVPVFGQTAFADAKYEDGKYDITAKALNSETGEPSAAGGFINEDAKLSIEGGKADLTITIPHSDVAEVTFLQIENSDPKTNVEGKKKHYTYQLSELKSTFDGEVGYTIGDSDEEHRHDIRFVLEGLDKIPLAKGTDEEDDPVEEKDDPVVEEDESDEATEDETDGNEEENSSDDSKVEQELINNADRTYEIKFAEKSLENHFDNPATLLHKGDKKYIQMSGGSGQLIKSLTVNGTEVTWGKLHDDGTYTMQFEIEDPLSEELAFGMVIDATDFGQGIMEHDVSLSFDESTKDLVEGSEESDEREAGTLVQKGDADEVYTIDYMSDQMDRLKNRFDNPVTLLYKDGQKYIQINGHDANYIDSLTIDGEEVTWGEIQDNHDYVFQFAIDSLKEELKFGMTIDTGNPEFGTMTHYATLSFDESTKRVVDGSEEETEEPKEEAKEETEKPAEQPKKEKTADLTPDKAYSINYVIKHEDGVQDSVANDFFTGKATLLEKDGKTYAQMMITNGDMVKGLSNKYGEALIVQENSDGSIVVQLRVDNDLADSMIDMSIVVPGLYSSDHTAQLVFDKDSKQETAVKGNVLVGTDNPDNKSGPTVEDGVTPVKPSFGDGQKGKGETTTAKAGNSVNPQTGDTTNIILFALLLIGSAVPLVVQARRRFN